MIQEYIKLYKKDLPAYTTILKYGKESATISILESTNEL